MTRKLSNANMALMAIKFLQRTNLSLMIEVFSGLTNRMTFYLFIGFDA
jgi:hypothetical protein